MHSSITIEPISRESIYLPAELEYDLRPEDFAAWLEFLACKAPRRLPKRVADGLIRVLGFIHAGVALAIGILALGSLAHHFPDKTGAAAVGLLFLAGLSFGIGLIAARESPGLYLCGFLAKPCRWACMLYLRSLARTEAKKGRTELLDVVSHYRFAINSEGITRTAEYRQRFGGDPIILWRRVDEISWKSVEVAGSTEQHAFFVSTDFLPVIVPRTSFADDASFHEFAQTAKRYHEARGGFVPHEPQKNLPRSQAVMPGPDDRFGPRPI